ncbi:MAG TPA: hypothetical protein VF134_09885 [Candidatus Dormibacteraeota bacterium]
MVSDAQAGTLGESLFTAYCIWSTAGNLESYRPVSDDDHRDFAVHARDGFGTAYVQVKTATHPVEGRVFARAMYPVDHVLEAPGFLYAILLVGADAEGNVAILTSWLVPSADFNRLAFHERTSHSPSHVQLVFEAHADPQHQDAWSRFRTPPLELGRRLLALLPELPKQAARIPQALLLLSPR